MSAECAEDRQQHGPEAVRGWGKINELRTISELLKYLDLEGNTVMIDTIGIQKEILVVVPRHNHKNEEAFF